MISAQEIATVVVIYTFKSLQDTFEARASEWALTGAILTMAVVFYLNDTMFLSPAFSGLRDIANNQYIWASVFTVVGMLRLAVLLVNGAYWRTPHLRSFTAFLCAGVWFTLFLGFVRDGSVLSALMPWIFFLDAYNAKRAARETGQSEFVQRHVKKREGKHVQLAQVSHT